MPDLITSGSKSVTTTVTTEKNLDYVVVDHVVIYRLTTKTTTDKRSDPRVNVEEEITSVAGLEAFLNGAVALPPFRKNHAAVLGTPELVEVMRSHGWLDDEFTKISRPLLENPYTRWIMGQARIEDLIMFDGGSHMCRDWQGVPLACATHFSYIDGRITDGQYDLEKALEILKNRKDVRFADGRGTSVEGRILYVPGYNQSPGCREYLSFVWMPSREDYLKMWKRIDPGVRPPTSTSKYHAIFDEDLLGLRAGGAARHSDYFGRNEEEDDD